MPQKDGTGPQGQGSKTGRGLGRCNPQGGSNPTKGRGGLCSGRGAGKGREKGRGKGGRKGN